MIFSGENVRCNRCGAIMRVVAQYDLICDECGNDGWLDEEDPDYPGEPMQRASRDRSSSYDDATDGGTWSSWNKDPEDY